MKDDKTVIMRLGQFPDISEKMEFSKKENIRVTLKGPYSKELSVHKFDASFFVGRSRESDVVISDSAISRKHLEIRKGNGGWTIYDLDSANGSFLNEMSVSQEGESLTFPTTILFGHSEYSLEIELVNKEKIKEVISDPFVDDSTQIIQRVTELPPNSSDSEVTEVKTSKIKSKKKEELSPEEIQRKYFSKDGQENAGEYTQLVRVAIQKNKQKKTKKYKIGIGVIGLFFVATVGLVVYQQSIILHTKALALDMFYDMKEMELSLGNVEYELQNEIAKIKQQEAKELLLKAAELKRENLKKMKTKYLTYLSKVEDTPFNKIKALFKPSKYEEKLILQVARKFGESELEVPKDFSNEVTRYIRYWQKGSRLKRAIRRLEKNKHKQVILSALKKQNLPPHFLYLVLQESNFKPKAIGPETRYGIAKGAWQFLPETGAQFGLKAGPLAKKIEYDAVDERFDFKKASDAGAKYLKHIYSTEAQASGLLVLAGYNYGHNRVKGLIRKMPKNPRERNFWKFIQKYKIPQETYDYVFYIFAAAVIGENPEYFGFKFRSPINAR